MTRGSSARRSKRRWPARKASRSSARSSTARRRWSSSKRIRRTWSRWTWKCPAWTAWKRSRPFGGSMPSAEPGAEVGVIMVSAHTKRGADVTIQALRHGAFDFIAKPTGPRAEENLAALRQQLASKIRLFMAERSRKSAAKKPPASATADLAEKSPPSNRTQWLREAPTPAHSGDRDRVLHRRAESLGDAAARLEPGGSICRS